ncbi:MAG: DUF6644 family protein [Hyphomicrobium sp.]
MPAQLEDLLNAVDQSAVSVAVRESLYIYPALETMHAIGLGLLFGSILAFDLRVLGVHKALPMQLLGRHLLPWVWVGFGINAASGLLMFASDAVKFSSNFALQAKFMLLVLAGTNALIFEKRLHPVRTGGPSADKGKSSPGSAKLSAALSIVLWLAIITAGRMIAFVK